MIVYHGGGYVGMTGAVHFALAGESVLIYDPDQRTVDGINAGEPRTSDFLRYLNHDVKRLVDAGKLRATTRWDEVVGAQVHIIAVPTERNGEPYDAIVNGVLDALFTHAQATDTVRVVLIESTLTPGTIDRFLQRCPVANAIGSRWHLAVCPRRDWFADPKKNLATLPRIVGGVTDESTIAAMAILSRVSATILPTTAQTAELTKALENALLHVPVMFAYQLAAALPERNVAEALRLAGTHWRLTPLYLGFGTGGRCVPLGTRYLEQAANGHLPMATAAVDWDGQFRTLIAQHVANVVGSHGHVLVLGIAYRPEFRDAGLSPGLAVAKWLLQLGIETTVHDPLWTPDELAAMTKMPVVPTVDKVLFDGGRVTRLFDAVLLATPHKTYLDWPADKSRWREGQYVLDGQGAWAQHKALFDRYGVTYVQVGTPGWLHPHKEA